MTPIHDRGYQRYGGRRDPHGRGWLVIVRAGVVERLRERRFLALLAVAWLPFLVQAVRLYVSANFAQASFLAPTAGTFRDFLDQQGLFVFFVTLYVGAGLIANDRRANALQLYLSKPITRVEYIAGKIMILAVYLFAVTLAPAVMLLLLQVMFAGGTEFLAANLFVLPAIVVFTTIQVAVASCSMVALSSLSKSQRFVAVMYAGTIFFTAAVYQILRAITGSSVWAWISPGDTLDVAAAAIFRVADGSAMPAPAAFLALALLVGASLWVLERRVRAVDVVT